MLLMLTHLDGIEISLGGHLDITMKIKTLVGYMNICGLHKDMAMLNRWLSKQAGRQNNYGFTFVINGLPPRFSR